MMVMSMLPAASAFAQTAPTVTLTEVGHSTVAAQVSVGSSVVFTASSTVSHPEYQFWVEHPNGTWTAVGGYSTNNSYTLTPSQSGDYLVTAYALSSSQLATGDYAAATNVGSNGLQQVDGVFVNSNVALSVPSASVIAGHQFTISATASNIYDAQYQFWYKPPSGSWQQSGNYSSSNTFTFTPSQSGNYTFIAYAKSPLALNDPEGALYSHVTTGSVVPQIQIGLSESTAMLTNNGKSTDTFTAGVTDPNGNPLPGVSVAFTSTASGVMAFSGSTTTSATTNASGVATATGTVGTTVGTALVTAKADNQSSSPVTFTTTQSAATQIGKVSVSPIVGTTTSETTTVSGTTTSSTTQTTYVGTAGTSETVSAIVEDAQGNPVPSQTVVLTGNHVDTNSSIAPYRQNSVQEPGSTSFTPFGDSNFGLATGSASGVVSFTVENSANSYSGAMSTSSTVNFNGQSLPFNTYTMELVPSSVTVKEGQVLPSSLTVLSGNVNNSGTVQVAWQPTHAVGTGLDIASTSSTGVDSTASLPSDYSSSAASVSVVGPTGATQYFNVLPYTTNHASASNNTRILFQPPSGDANVPTGSSLTYTLTTSGHGVINNIDGVKLNAGWTYDSTTGNWTSGSTSGLNYDAESVTVTYQYAKNNFGELMNVLVSTPNHSRPLQLAGINPVFNDMQAQNYVSSGVNIGSAGGSGSTILSFGTNDGVAETAPVKVSASSNYLKISNPSPATAQVTYSTTVTSGAYATFSPQTDSNSATTLNNHTMSETITVYNANGNPVANALTAIDGSIPSRYSGYYNSTTSNSALWVTQVDGTSLTNGSLPDAFPLVKAGTSLSSDGYVNPTANAGLYYASKGRLFVYTNSQGQVTLTLEGGQAAYVSNPTTPTTQVSQNVGNNEFWVSAWNPATTSNLGYAQIGATGVVVTSPATAASATISPTGATGLSVTTSQNVTVQALDANGNPVSFGKITLAASGTNSNAWLTAVNGTTITRNISGNSVATPLPLFDVALASPSISLGYHSVSGTISGVGYTGSGFTTSNPSVVVTTNSQGQANLTFQVSGFKYYSSTGTTTLSISGTSGQEAGQVSSISPTPSGFTGFFWTY